MNGNPPSTEASAAHRYVTRVYYEDTDAAGVVYHATYLRMAERARTEALRALDIAHAELTAQHGLVFVVRRVEVDYAAPARLDDTLLVLTRVTGLRTASLELRQDFHHDADAADRPLVRALVSLACVQVGTFRPARIPQRWCTALGALAA